MDKTFQIILLKGLQTFTLIVPFSAYVTSHPFRSMPTKIIYHRGTGKLQTSKHSTEGNESFGVIFPCPLPFERVLTREAIHQVPNKEPQKTIRIVINRRTGVSLKRTSCSTENVQCSRRNPVNNGTKCPVGMMLSAQMSGFISGI